MFWPPKADSDTDDAALAMIRITLGVVTFVHGSRKMPGWFGGSGFSGTMGMFGNQMHIPAPLALLAIAAEFFGGIGLLPGLPGRVAAPGITVAVMLYGSGAWSADYALTQRLVATSI